MAVLLSLLSSVTFGVGDFCGGMATKRTPATTVLLWSHVVGLGLIVAAVPLVGGVLTAPDLLIGAAGGLAGAVGVGLLYQALSIGPMSVVAPTTALLAAAVPVVVGLAQGDRPDLAVSAGMVLALVAIVLVSAEGGGSLRPSDLRGVSFAVGAGFAFGVFYTALSYTDDGAGVWPLVAARAASVTTMTVLALSGRVGWRVPAGAPRRLTAAAGTLDVGANVLYLLAVREGLLSVVSVLSSLYPVSTIVLARIVLRERFITVQRIGMALAVPATLLIAT